MSRAPWSDHRRANLAVACGIWLTLGLTVLPVSQTQVNRQAAAVAQFNKNIQTYVDVRQKAVSSFQPLKEDADPKAISDREKALGDAIRTARAGVGPGNIFTRDVAPMFRAAIKAHFRRRTAKGRQVMMDELPHFRPMVNQTYPSDWPLQTFPAPLLQQLPKLPSDLEYRFVSDALILRDVKANLVVDFMLDVF